MPAAARDLTITYGSFTCGSGTARPIAGKLSIERSDSTFTVDWSFVVRGDTPAAMASEVAAAEAALQTPNQVLQISMGDGSGNATLYHDFSHALATGMDSRPQIVKREDDVDSSLSRRYYARVVLQLPADRLADAGVGRRGRRDSSVNVTFSESRRREVTIQGVYTAVPSSGQLLGRSQYEAQISAYAAAVLASIDPAAVWELVREPQAEVDDTVDTAAGVGRGKVCRFTRLYRELLFRQKDGSGVLDDPDIVDQHLVLALSRFLPGGPETRGGLDFVEASYSAWIVRGVNPRTKWDNQIRAFVIAQAQAFFSKSIPIAITEEHVDIDLDDQKITARLTTAGTPGPLVSNSITVEDSLEPGKVRVPAWDGNRFAAYSYHGHGKRTRVITRQLRHDFSTIGDPFQISALPRPRSGDLVRWTKTHAPVRVGAAEEAHSFSLMDLTERQEIEYYLEPGAPPSQVPGEPLGAVPGFTNPNEAFVTILGA